MTLASDEAAAVGVWKHAGRSPVRTLVFEQRKMMPWQFIQRNHPYERPDGLVQHLQNVRPDRKASPA